MAKRRSLEETLQALGDLRREPLAKESIRELRKVLRSKSSFAVAKAAQIAGEFEIGELAPDLAQAFDRFLAAPAESDKNCRAKEAIAEALYRLGHDGVDLFLRGIHHVQREPVWGGSVDSACALRGWCALGLVRAQYADAMAELADLLADPEPRARTGAIAALAASGREEAVLLLRFKALTGDEEPEVMADSLSALLELAPERSLDLVARFLHEREPSTREVAALALGQSRRPEAFEILRRWSEETRDPELRRTGLVAIAALRREEGIEYLLSLIAHGPAPVASDALGALEVYFDDEKLLGRVRRAAGARKDLELSPAAAVKLGKRR